MKRIVTVLIFLLILSSTSCMKSLMKGMATNSSLGNKLLIHKNPKVGDYSIFTGNGNTTIYKVIAVSSDSVTVRFEYSFIPELIFEGVVDLEGNIKKIDIIDKANNNERIPGKIAKPGDTNYIEWTKLPPEKLAALKLPAQMVVKAGTFDYEIVSYKVTSLGMDFYYVFLTNKNVKFLQVAFYGDSRLIYELSEFGNNK